jgi:hypothetical protein
MGTILAARSAISTCDHLDPARAGAIASRVRANPASVAPIAPWIGGPPAREERTSTQEDGESTIVCGISVRDRAIQRRDGPISTRLEKEKSKSTGAPVMDSLRNAIG